jgi:hypothetical protein
MGAQDFLTLFLPKPPNSSDSPQFRKGMFDNLISKHSDTELKWYDVFVSSDSDPRRPPHSNPTFQIETISPFLENLHIVKTSNLTDEAPNKFPFDLKPDCSVYTKDKYKEKKLKFSLVDFIIEFKKMTDPFVDPDSQPNSPENLNPFVCSEGSGLLNLGQITAYATSILGVQYRTHTFMVFIVDDYARLLRWDRGGVVVTEPIRFNEDPHLFDFLIRYDAADSKVRGHDSTVKLPNDDEIKLAKAAVSELARANSFLAVDISDRRYIIQSPQSRPRIPVGRWTRPSFAYDVKGNCRVLLKDSWRVLMPGIQPEGDIYQRLHEQRVPNIPRYLVAGDVGDDTHHRSRTDEVIDKYVTPHPCWKITPHRHYRIVLGTIGRRLVEFKYTKEFVSAMHAALKGEITMFLAVSLRSLTRIIAHEAAYGAGILHRDISAGNILIVGKEELNSEDLNIEGGMLIDWDLSKIVHPEDNTARQFTRTVS